MGHHWRSMVLQGLIMQQHKNRQQVSDILEGEKMSSTSSTKLQIFSPQSLFPSSFVKALQRSFPPCSVLHNEDSCIIGLVSSTDNIFIESGGTKILGEDHRVEDLTFNPKKTYLNTFFNFQKLENENMELLKINILKAKILNLHIIASPVNSSAIFTHVKQVKSVKQGKNYMFFLFLPPNKNTSILYAISIKNNLQDFQPRMFLPNYTLFDFRPIFHTQDIIECLYFDWQKQTRNKIELFNNLMKPASDEKKQLNIALWCQDRPWQSHLKRYLKRFRGRKKQFAFACVLNKNGELKIFYPVYPVHKNKSKNGVSLHCEEILIGQIDEFLQSTPINVKIILIYTYNSPCLNREKNLCPCMFQLCKKVHEWHSKYGCLIDVAFTEFWGLRGPNIFRDLAYTDISSASNAFYPYIEACKNIPFKLDITKDLKNKLGSVYQFIQSVKNKEKMNKDIKYALDELVKLAETPTCFLRQEHLDHIQEKIDSFQFELKDKISKIWLQNWHEMVDIGASTPIKEKITPEFNTKAVQHFLKYLNVIWWNGSPLRLYHIPQKRDKK